MRKSASLVVHFHGMADAIEGDKQWLSPKATRRARLLAIMYGAIPQSIKLIAMTGMPISQLWGLAYLMSFFITESLILAYRQGFIGEKGEEETPDPEIDYGGWRLSQRMTVFRFVAFAAQVLWFVYQIETLIPDSETFKRGSRGCGRLYDSKCVSLVCVFLDYALILFLGVPVCLFASSKSDRVDRWIDPNPTGVSKATKIIFLVIPLIVGSFILGCLAVVVFLNVCSDRSGSVASWLVAALLVATASGLWYGGHIFLSNLTSRIGPSNFPKRASWKASLWAAANLAALILYYALVFDPSKTHKPSWADYLG